MAILSTVGRLVSFLLNLLDLHNDVAIVDVMHQREFFADISPIGYTTAEAVGVRSQSTSCSSWPPAQEQQQVANLRRVHVVEAHLQERWEHLWRRERTRTI